MRTAPLSSPRTNSASRADKNLISTREGISIPKNLRPVRREVVAWVLHRRLALSRVLCSWSRGLLTLSSHHRLLGGKKPTGDNMGGGEAASAETPPDSRSKTETRNEELFSSQKRVPSDQWRMFADCRKEQAKYTAS